MYLRRNSKVKAEISFYEPLNIDWDGNELLLSDILGTDNDVVYNMIEDQVDKQLLFVAMKKLNCRENEIIKLRFGLNGEREKPKRKLQICLEYHNHTFQDLKKNNQKIKKRNK